MSRPEVYYDIPKMSTKVISSKIESELYDELLEACNIRGCTISQFIKDACLQAMDKRLEFSEVKDNTGQIQDSELSNLERKVTELETDLQNKNSTILKQGNQGVNKTIVMFNKIRP